MCSWYFACRISIEFRLIMRTKESDTELLSIFLFFSISAQAVVQLVPVLAQRSYLSLVLKKEKVRLLNT